MRKATFLVLLALAGPLGCGEEETVVRLILSANSSFNSPQEVGALIRRYQVIIDKTGGLKGIRTPVSLGGGTDVVDWDDDGYLEVVYTTREVAHRTPPIIELEVGTNSGATLSYRVYGFAGGVTPGPERAMALGGVNTACRRGNRCDVLVPFNLLAKARAPKVVMTSPPAGESPLPRELAYVTVVFSTEIEVSSLTGNISLVGQEGHQPSIDLVTQTNPSPFGADGYAHVTSARVRLRGALIESQYTLEVTDGVRSSLGFNLDQLPGDEAVSSFLGVFGEPAPAEPWDDCPAGFEYNPSFAGCVPIASCKNGCAEGFVCDVWSNACTEDCRVYSACVKPGGACDQETGLCE